ncbi:unnamed protein product, partial [Urochloa humidicola]
MISLGCILTDIKIVRGDFDNLKISFDVHAFLVPATGIGTAYHKQAQALRKQLIRAMRKPTRGPPDDGGTP